MIAALGAAWAGGYWFTAFWLIAALIVHWEWQNLIGGPNHESARCVRRRRGCVVAAPLATNDAVFWAIVALLAAAVAALSDERNAGLGFACCRARACSTPARCWSRVCLLRASWPYGLYAILWLFAVVWGADVMAYFGGRLIGGPKLWPRVSPGENLVGFLRRRRLRRGGRACSRRPLASSVPCAFLPRPCDRARWRKAAISSNRRSSGGSASRIPAA